MASKDMARREMVTLKSRLLMVEVKTTGKNRCRSPEPSEESHVLFVKYFVEGRRIMDDMPNMLELVCTKGQYGGTPLSAYR